jgi:ATP-dependent Clp protease ATP-binding subunit ClpB
VDFKNTVVIMTSNVGSHAIADRAREGRVDLDASVRQELTEALRRHFKPEFLNRVDDIIVFHALRRDDIRHIVDIQMAALLGRLADRKITLELSDGGRDLIIEEGYDPVYGARPLRRTLQRRLLDPLALAVLDGTVRDGTTVRADLRDGQLVLEPVAQPAAQAAAG